MRSSLLIAAIAAVCLAPAESSAYYGFGYGYGIGGLYRSLDFPTERRVPYFAAHPPVYYSTPVPRTYGHSPFAYPPTYRTPEVVAPIEVKEVVNPHVPSAVRQKAEAAAKKRAEMKSKQNRTISASEETKPGPVTIENPFFNTDQEGRTI